MINNEEVNRDFEKKGFMKYKDDSKKIMIHLYERKPIKEYKYEFNFETNIINYIPNTDIFFIISASAERETILFFINKSFNVFNKSAASPVRSVIRGISDKYKVCEYIFDYSLQKEIYNGKEFIINPKLNIDTDENYYLEVSVEKI